MSDLKHRVWWVRWTPTNKIQLHPTLALDLRDGEEWFENLVLDIGKNGLDNPILVHHKTIRYCDTPNRVVHGNNRFRAVKRLGWKYAPCLVCGELDRSFAKWAVELHSLAECQSYITDGEFTNHKTGPKVLNANWAQTEIYLRNKEPYFDGTPELPGALCKEGEGS